MSYPWWYVPYLTSPMVIAIVAIVHVLVSQYAVGGGILLARENRYALKKNDAEYRKYWKNHARFFVLLTVVFGSITGVGIWWTIGLASPLATEVLIRTFVFGWAIEWVFFVLELVAAFGFYYFWDKLPKGTHIAMGWIYALAAWISLVLITGITSFMLNSKGLFGDWNQPEGFWFGFLNRQFLPQTLIRTGTSLILGTVYVYMHLSWIGANDRLREKTVRRMRVPSVFGLVFLLTGMAGWLVFLPKSSLMMLEGAATMNLFLGFSVASCLGLAALVWLGPFRAPQKMNLTTSVGMFFLVIAAIGSGEFVREAIRKPYVVDQVVYGNQIMVDDSRQVSMHGFLNSGVWTGLYLQNLQEKYPNLEIYTPAKILAGDCPNATAGEPREFQPIAGQVSETSIQQVSTSPPSPHEVQTAAVLNLPVEGSKRSGNEDWLQMTDEDQLALGKVIFMHHCNDCHAIDHGYSAAAPLLTGRTEAEVVQFLKHLNRPRFFMPPWCGNDVEATLLARYLVSVRPEMPSNITGREEEPPVGNNLEQTDLQ